MHEFDNETLVGMAILGNAEAVKVRASIPLICAFVESLMLRDYVLRRFSPYCC